MSRTIFVTGTDTGVGKTIFAASLLWHLRSRRINALGMKPFCSGSRDDAKLLQRMQPGELSTEEVNPFFYKDAVAPLVAHRKGQGLNAILKEAVERIRAVAQKCDVLIIEGSGGLFVPLGERFDVADLIKILNCEVVAVARNRLGTINHTLLTVGALKKSQRGRVSVVLMDCGDRDDSTDTNFKILRELLAPILVLEYPSLGRKPASLGAFQRNKKILQKVLAEVFN